MTSPYRAHLTIALLASTQLMLIACKRAETATTGRAVELEAQPSQLCIVRHAEAFRNVKPTPEDLTPEQLDTLTPNGEDQARRVVGVVPQPVGLVWSSPAKRTRQTAELSGLQNTVEIVAGLRMLEGDVSWDERVGHWEVANDPRPEPGESLTDGHVRAMEVLSRLRSELNPEQHAVLVTHGDIASILIGELIGTPLFSRPMTHVLGSGETLCLPLTAIRE